MKPSATRREFVGFAVVLFFGIAAFFHESLFEGKILSSADVLFVEASFRDIKGPDYEPLNRLLMDPVLQFQPWLAFNRSEIRQGRLPLWNPYVGCGAPHLANGQSAVFDPFNAIAYFGPFAQSFAWMAAARLWVAGLGMFLLANHWGLRRTGRWFAGLVYPFTGFLIVWLLYPVTNVAIWFPWVVWSSDRLLDRPSLRRVGAMALLVGLCLLGGHVQTSSHVLLATGLNMIWRLRGISKRAFASWVVGVVLGIGIAAIEILPLADYLTKSPVWTDRAAERKLPWTIVRPRVLDVGCTALPYAFGSQRRGHPNLARALGVHNINESAGGFAGLATILWLAPLGLVVGWKNSRVKWLGFMAGFAFLAAYRWFPADNILRALPVLNVTDNRRLSIWISFALCLLGGLGIDRLGAVRRRVGWGYWGRIWIVGGVGCLIVAASIGLFRNSIHERAVAHYDQTASVTPGANRVVYRARADRQTRDTIAFVRLYYSYAGLHAIVLGLGLIALRKRRLSPKIAKLGLLILTLGDVFAFGYGLNPALEVEDANPSNELTRYLIQEASPPARILGLGEEFPPNVAMRYGLADIRNYDSVEMANSLDFFAPLYPSGGGERTSRRTITWDAVVRSRNLLNQAHVKAIIAASPPPEGVFDKVLKVGEVWVVDPSFRRTFENVAKPIVVYRRDGVIDVQASSSDKQVIYTHVIIDQTWDEGWSRDGLSSGTSDPFLHGIVSQSDGTLVFRYRPRIVEIAGMISIFSFFLTVFTLTGFGLLPSTRYITKRLRRT